MFFKVSKQVSMLSISLANGAPVTYRTLVFAKSCASAQVAEYQEIKTRKKRKSVHEKHQSKDQA